MDLMKGLHCMAKVLEGVVDSLSFALSTTPTSLAAALVQRVALLLSYCIV